MVYTVELTSIAKHALRKLPKAVRRDIGFAIDRLQVDNPSRAAGVRKLTARAGYRLRVGDYRVLFELESGRLVVLVIDVDDRKDIYR